MATQLQLRRGNTNSSQTFTGAVGEVTVNTQTHELTVHDGVTVGGYTLAKKSDVYTKSEIDTNYISTKNITNCITEIPQDINLESNNGRLILKAGSKLYRPNGVGVFDDYIIPNDITFNPTAYDDTYLYFIKSNGTTFNISDIKCFSGATAPTGFYGNYAVWYDTTNNLIKFTQDAGSTWEDNLTFPICLASCIANTSLNIKNIFNGFGYIGSTVFALPGVKGLVPCGRNTDRTLNNLMLNIESVKTRDFSSIYDEHLLLFPHITGSLNWYGKNNIYYDKENNYIHNKSNDNIIYNCVCGSFDVISNKIQNFDIYTPFRSVDYNDTDFIAHQAMPSSKKYTSYPTVTATDTPFIAPEDGYAYVQGQVDTAYGYCILALLDASGNIMLSTEAQTPVNTGVRLFLPVSRGDTFKIQHADFTINIFRFVYANGAK